jgi:hypothetical protein
MFVKKAIHLVLVCSAVTLCLSVSAGAAVLTVGPGGLYARIQDAVDAASDGDTILVRAGTYSSVLIDDRALQVVADATDIVAVKEGITVQNLSTNRNVVLLGLEVPAAGSAYLAFQHEGLHLRDNLGAVRVEDCTLNGSMGHWEPFTQDWGWDGVLVDHCDDVALVRCQVTGGEGIKSCGGGEGIDAGTSTVALYDCTIQGGEGGYGLPGSDGGPGGAGYRSPDSFLFASGCEFSGGKGGHGCNADEWSPAGDGGDGGHGIHLKGSNAEAQLLDCLCKGGDGGNGGAPYLWFPAGKNGDPGENIKIEGGGIVNFIQGTAHTFEMPSPVREKESIKLTFTGQPGDLAGLFLAANTNSLFVPAMKGQWLLSIMPMPLFIYVGVLPGSGTLSWPTVIPDMGPGFDAAMVYIQSIYTDGTGEITLGSPRTLVMLDESY